MPVKTFLTAAGALALGLAGFAFAQGPMYDNVIVNLPYSVTIGNQTLQPGEYRIKELPSQDKSRVLTIYGDNGMKFETSAMTIPAYDPQTLDKTKVVLHHIGNDYYFDKVWIQGKNYGYEFPLPSSVKQRELEASRAVTVAAQYTPAPTETTTTAQVTPPAAAAPEPTPAPAPQVAETPAPAPEPAPEVAQNTPPPAPEATEPTPAPEANRELPTTNAGWLMMLLGGGSLSGAGLFLRRKRL
jgi:LPXTG-motif cell wall-anchored protein